MVREKVYVEVYVRFDRDGNMTPVSVTWENGKLYPIDRIVDVRRGRGSMEKSFLRYAVYIGKSKTALFYEDPAWFVERKR